MMAELELPSLNEAGWVTAGVAGGGASEIAFAGVGGGSSTIGSVKLASPETGTGVGEDRAGAPRLLVRAVVVVGAVDGVGFATRL